MKVNILPILLVAVVIGVLAVGGCWAVKQLTPKPPKPDKTEMYIDAAREIIGTIAEHRRAKDCPPCPPCPTCE